MQGADLQGLPETPAVTTTATAARNAVHLARLLRRGPYPAQVWGQPPARVGR